MRIGLHAAYLRWLLDRVVAPGRRVIVSNYRRRSRAEPPLDVAAYLRQLGLQVRGEALSRETDG